jgi:hypothetical protein
VGCTLFDATACSAWGFVVRRRGSSRNPRLRCSLRCAARSREGSSRFEWGMPPIPHTPRSGRIAGDGAGDVVFFVFASWFGAEPSLALLASGCAARSREGSSRFERGMLPSPTPPEADDLRLAGALRLADAVGLACSSRYTEPSEASGEAGGTEASLRVGALNASHPPDPQKRAICDLLRRRLRWPRNVCEVRASARRRAR